MCIRDRDYSDDESPLSLKSDFILSLCELIVGGKEGLQPVQKTIIDRCVRLVYQTYLNDPRPEVEHWHMNMVISLMQKSNMKDCISMKFKQFRMQLD